MSTISVCMIIKNEEKILPYTLPSLAKEANELIIIDTGSTDNSIEIARKYTSNVFFFKWIDDYSAAKNEAIKKASKEWVLMMDADEYISPENIKKIKIEINQQNKFYYIPVYECKKYENARNEISLKRIKLFRNFIGVHYKRPVNEQLYLGEKCILDATSINEDIFISHWGGTKALTTEELIEKRNRYVNLFKRVIKKYPNDPLYYYFLGLHYYTLGDQKKSYWAFNKAQKLAMDTSIKVRSLYNMGNIKVTFNINQAKKLLFRALKISEQHPEPLNLIGSIFLMEKNMDEAQKYFEKASSLTIPINSLLSVDTEQYTLVPWRCLSIILIKKQKYKEALIYLTKYYQAIKDPVIKNQIDLINKSLGRG